MDYRTFVKQEMLKDPPKSRAEASRKMKEIARKWRSLRTMPNPMRLDLGSFLVGGVAGVLAGKFLLKG